MIKAQFTYPLTPPPPQPPQPQQQPQQQYSSSEYTISAKDAQGHYERLFCQVPPLVKHAISKIIASRSFPFSTAGDLVRWCVVTGLRELVRREPAPGVLGVLEAVQDVLAEEKNMRATIAVFAVLGEVVQGHIADGAEGEARRLVGGVLKKFRTIDNPYWRARCEKELWARFGYLLEEKAAGKVRLISGAGDNE